MTFRKKRVWGDTMFGSAGKARQSWGKLDLNQPIRGHWEPDPLKVFFETTPNGLPND